MDALAGLEAEVPVRLRFRAPGLAKCVKDSILLGERLLHVPFQLLVEIVIRSRARQRNRLHLRGIEQIPSYVVQRHSAGSARQGQESEIGLREVGGYGVIE